MSVASGDVLAIRDDVRKFRQQLAASEADNQSMQAEVGTLRQQGVRLRSQYNILSCIEEVKFHEDTASAFAAVLDPNDSGAASNAGTLGGANYDKKFREANFKLEITILNEDIRPILPRLEREAAAAEQRLRDLQRQAREQEAERELLPPEYLTPVSEMRARLETLRKTKEALKIKLERSHKSMHQDLGVLRSANDKLRLDAASSSEELYHVQLEAETLRQALVQDQGRIALLKDEVASLQNALRRYHGGAGWQTEAFLAATGSKSGTIDVSLVDSALAPWVPYNRTSSSSNGGAGSVDDALHLDAEDISSMVGRSYQADRLAPLSLQEFVKVCDAVLKRC